MGAGPGPTLLCVCSAYKGDRFLKRCKQEGCHVILLTSEQHLHESWPRQAIDEVYALPHFPGPWLLKPRSQASAIGIHKVTTADEVRRAIDRLGDDQSFHLIERFVPGDLFHVESLVAESRVVFAEVNQYWRPVLDVHQGGGVYASRTVPRDGPLTVTLRRLNEQILTGFGLGRGAS